MSTGMGAPARRMARDGTAGSSRPGVDEAVDELLTAWDEVQRLMTRMPGVVEQRFGIPPHRLHVLGAIERGATRIQDIADGSWTSVSAASRTVDGLVRDGWLDRGPDPDDRRASRVTLTAHGRAELDVVRDWATGMVADLVASLGVDRAGRMATDLTDFASEVRRSLDREGG